MGLITSIMVLIKKLDASFIQSKDFSPLALSD